MITSVSLEELEKIIATEYPCWNAQAIQEEAKELLSYMDVRLEEPLRAFVKENKTLNFRYGEFSLSSIQSFRHPCSYFYALILMDIYLKDPLGGKARILRR